MAIHQRVLQIRAESGIPLPPRPAPPQQDREAVRNDRLSMIQMESLGSVRRDRISSQDFPADRHSLASSRGVNAARLSNQPGTKENRDFQSNEARLVEWNNAWATLEDDGTIEEPFDDIAHGQTHRAKLMDDIEYGEEETQPSLRRHHADAGDRARGGGRGGRGGGFAGSRSRAIGLKRIAVGIPTPMQHLGTAAQASPPPHEEGDHPNRARSPIRGGSMNRSLLSQTRGEASGQGLSSSNLSREPSTPTRNPASPSRPIRPPREFRWGFGLADPSFFMKASKEILALSSNVAPVAKSNTAPANPASSILANPLTTTAAAAQGSSSSYPSSNVAPVAKSNTAPANPTSSSLANPLTTAAAVAAQGASSSSSASSSTTTKQAAADAATTSSAPHSAIGKVTEAKTAPSSPAPHLTPSRRTTREPESALRERAVATTPSALHLAKTRVAGAGTEPSSSATHVTPSKKATREPDWAVSRREYLKTRSSEEWPVERGPGWPIVFPGRGQDRGSSLIDFGDASTRSHEEAYSHKTGGEAKAVQTTSSSPGSKKSYSGDLLGLDIQPDAGQTRATQEPRSNAPSGTSSIPSIADIHAQLSSLMPVLKDTLQPELIKSYESIITELQGRSAGAAGAAGTSKAAPDVEPPIEAFGRLSIRDDDPTPMPVSKKISTPSVDRPRVHSPPPKVKSTGVDEGIFIINKPSTSRNTINTVGYLGRMTAAANPLVPSHARMDVNELSTRSTSIPGNQLTIGIPGVVESSSQPKTHQSTSAPSMIVETDKVQKVKEQEEDYPEEGILITTFKPSSPSKLNRGGFYKR